MADRSLVRNAGSPAQVKRAERAEARAQELFRASLSATLGTEAGRVVVWELLTRAGVFKSIYRPGAEIYYLAGRQDYGHELMALVLETSAELYREMETEARSRQSRADRETDAAQTPPADGGEIDG